MFIGYLNNLSITAWITFTVTALPRHLYFCVSERPSTQSSGNPCNLQHSVGVSFLTVIPSDTNGCLFPPCMVFRVGLIPFLSNTLSLEWIGSFSYFGSGHSSKMSDNEHALPVLGDAEILAVKHLPLEVVPQFIKG